MPPPLTAPHPPPPRARSVPAGILLPALHDALSRQGRFTFPLRGDSMLPTLPTACDIEVVPLDGEPRLGELLVFLMDDALIAHRLVARAPGALIAQGDNRRAPDRPIPPDHALARVVTARVEGRQVWPRRSETARAPVWLARSLALRAARWAWHRVRR